MATAFDIEGNVAKIAYPLALWEEGNAVQLLSGIAGNIFGMKAVRNLRLIDVAVEQNLVLRNSSIGFTGMAAISGRKPEYILEGIIERNLFDDPVDHLVFVDDGLARGAALMGRCMNSLGKPKNPIGGVRGGPCIMRRRIKIGK